jgi:flagellar motor switch protein FliN/FliY
MSDPASQHDEQVDDEAQEALPDADEQARDEDGIDLESTTRQSSPPDEEAVTVSAAAFDELEDQGDRNGPGDLKLEMILDVPVTLTVEVGRTRVSVRDLLKLNRGSVVELDQLVTQPMSLLVNDTLVAHGEAVMVNERFGIRLTEVVSAEQRIRKLT